MSQSERPPRGIGTDTNEDPPDVDVLIDEHRELFERLAESNLPVAEYFQNALTRFEEADRDA
ncbi:hypothetical protein ACFQH6_20540 [Halobacteriaceae archaeon GCM10025711]